MKNIALEYINNTNKTQVIHLSEDGVYSKLSPIASSHEIPCDKIQISAIMSSKTINIVEDGKIVMYETIGTLSTENISVDELIESFLNNPKKAYKFLMESLKPIYN